MLMSDYTAELLNLEDVIITNVENIAEQLHIYIELPRTKHVFPACGASTDRIHDYRMQVKFFSIFLLRHPVGGRTNLFSTAVICPIAAAQPGLQTGRPKPGVPHNCRLPQSCHPPAR